MELMFSSTLVNLIGNFFCKDLKANLFKIYLFYNPLTYRFLTKKNAVYRRPYVNCMLNGVAAVLSEAIKFSVSVKYADI